MRRFFCPADKLGPHVAPLGLKFYNGSMFPESYKNQIFVAEHGSWDRSKKSGHNVSLVDSIITVPDMKYLPAAG